MTSLELTYATEKTPPFKRWLIQTIENLSGRKKLLKIYHRWRETSVGTPRMWRDALDMIGTQLDLAAAEGWQSSVPEGPLVLVANHPFGIADGVGILAIAESLGRPYRILANNDFMRLPELQQIALPIDFAETKEALATNLKTRAETRRLLKEGYTIVIFPSGGVATAENPFGKAEELPWKQFAVRLVQQSGATVLPVYFEGQNTAFFHFISRYSLSIRLSLLVLEFRHKIGKPIKATVGAPVPWETIAANAEGGAIIDELYVMVQRLAPGAENLPRAALLPRPAHVRRKYPWDEPAELVRRPAESGTRDAAANREP